jgi:hypothetical protein
MKKKHVYMEMIILKIKKNKNEIRNQENKDWNRKTKNKKEKHVLYIIGERKAKKKNHHTPSHTNPRGKGHGGASKKIIKGQVWPPIDVVYTI